MVILLFIFWIILNGKLTPEVVIFGLVLTALVTVLQRILFGRTLKDDLRALKKSPYFAAFLAVLLWEVLKANLKVMRMIPRGEKQLHPVLVTFRTDLKTDFCRFLFANSITLTPGTITVEAEEDVFRVHCLAETLLDTSDSNRCLKLLRKMEA